ncbi:sugar transferase [Parapedobacter lycopersici]|uniref:sugar transferase n=1 Tax=Parapedobacter lycopersici TaxID=1864939 RepID=UPI00214DB6C8|nr:sugar transferase [Parapedobacter lycopersici]
MIREEQIQEITYPGDNNMLLHGGVSLQGSIDDFFTYQPAFRVNLQSIKKRILVHQETVFIKRVFDVVFSSLVIIAGLPVFLVLMLITKLTSRGPVFYKQERIGKEGRPFFIYKFRSMRPDAEKNGPQLASDHDPRVTKWGRFMRRTHLDELPQFWNVLKGDMAVVGPRPEREYFINEIAKRAPAYRELFRIKPGITSIGQVTYGYAETVDQMCDRMVFDLEYLSKMGLRADLNIIFQTVRVMTQGKGQ